MVELKHPDIYTDNLTNPTVIVEILSESTKNYDRGMKFALNRSIKTLQEYILIDSTAVAVEIFTREGDNSWLLKEFKQLFDNFFISTVGLTLCLQDIYDDVNFNE